jgi:hypothetical protein
MKCSDLQSDVSLYADGLLDAAETAVFEDHLETCPLCRQQVDDIRLLKNSLRQFSRPAMPVAVSNRVRLAIRDDIRSGRASSVTASTREWFQMRLMPLSVGILTSVVVGFSFLAMLFSGGLAIDDYKAGTRGSDTRVLIAANRNPYDNRDPAEISASAYARTRLAVAGESPSINPQGALIALSRSLVARGIKNDEVVVVADVFSNGLARIAEVVEPSQDISAVGELEKALDSDPPNAPFVPAAMDSRSDSVRVVLKFQSVEVNSRSPRRKH